MNKFEEMVAVEDLGWDLDKARVIFDWASHNGYWADWSEWDSDQFIDFFETVEREYFLACPESPLRASESDEKAASVSRHPVSRSRATERPL